MIKANYPNDILLNYDFSSKFNFVPKNDYFYALKSRHGFYIEHVAFQLVIAMNKYLNSII